MSIDTLMHRFQNGERGALARLLTYIENEHPLADAGLDLLHAETGGARLIGITGPPGAGKSTLTNALIKGLRSQGKTVAVLAVDPSSAITGGATLGDRIRMLETYDDDGVYIRSMATRGQYGGLTMATGRVAQALDAFGFNVVILETVGVGQDEVDIASAADTTLLLQVPGMGDSVQTIKAGILEIADIIVVNKADLPDARVVQRDLRAMLRYRDHPDWLPPVVPTVSTSGEGIQDLIEQIEAHSAYLESSGEGKRRQKRRIEGEIRRQVHRDIERDVDQRLATPDGTALVSAVRDRRMTPRSAARQLIGQLRDSSAVENGVE